MTSANDGKDVKINQTSGLKGKSYYIELYKSLEARLTEGGDARERTKHLCVAWQSVHSLCQHSAPSTHTHLLNWIQRHTARAVLQTEWQKPERKDDRKSLEEAIDAFIKQVAETPRDGKPLHWEEHLVARGEWFKRVLDKPWDHPVLTLLLNPNGTPPTDDEVLGWLKEERGVTFVVRLHTLVREKCEDIAVSLASALMERARATLPPVADSEQQTGIQPVGTATPTFADKLKEEAGFTPDVWEVLTDIEFVLLHKRDSIRCIALAKQTPLLEAYPLIERLQKRLEVSPREKRLWKNAKEVAILIAQVVIARCMVVKTCESVVRTALYCCARLLARLLTSRLSSAADALAAQAPTARHLHTLAQAVDKQLSPTNEEMKPYVCELYVRAITAGMNELERLKLKTEKEAEARSMEKTLASWFVQLGTVLSRSDRISCECILTAFSLHPSQKMYERIDSAPPLALVLTDANESKEETVKSDFGSWANDSRSQTNLVKTSETLNMKHTQNQANVLSSAIFNEGEALGLTPELCQDIAVLLAGPRVKTLSWDMDRALLLENCRVYSEMTHEGTRALTRELKYLNLDLQQYQHLPEEKDDDENDPYYGIERGYEHLAILEEPEEIWEDANHHDTTETASSIEEDYLIPRRKKKTKQVPLTSDEDSDPLSFVAETKRTQRKKERPHSKERSKGKKNQNLVDPLEINVPSQNQSQIKLKKEPKQKKERKKKEKIPKVIGGKRSALASLIGMKVGKAKKKSKDLTILATPVTDSDYDSQGKNSLTSINSDGNDPDNIEQSISGAEHKQEPKNARAMYTMMEKKTSPSLAFERSPSNLTRMHYKPQTPNTIRQQSLSNLYKTMCKNYKNHPEDNIRTNLARLIEFRRETDNIQQKLALQNMPYTPPRQPAIIKPDIPLHTNISPKSVTIPEIPKSYINKEQTEKMAEILRAQQKDDSKDSVIQYAEKTNDSKTPNAVKKTVTNKTASSSVDSRIKTQHLNTKKMTDIVNPSYDRLMAEISERHSRGQGMKSAHSQYQPVHSQRPAQRSYNIVTPGQRDFQNFLKGYDQNKYNMVTPQAIDMSSKSSREVKKPIMPVSRVTPVVPYVPKPETKVHSSKQPAVKKPEQSLNTFSRLSYHKNKQNEIKNKIQTLKPIRTTTTYQEVSSELDEIIKEHQRAQMKVIQAKRDIVEKSMKPAKVSGSVNKCDSSMNKHPLLSNLLQNSTSSCNASCRNENQLKNNPIQQTPTAPPKTTLSEKDNNDLLNLLRQQANLNSSRHSSTNINKELRTKTVCKDQSGSIYNANSNQTQQQLSNFPRQITKSVTSSLETKIINVITNTLLKPGLHEINKTLSINKIPSSDSAIKKPIGFTQNTNRSNAPSKNQIESKYVPESSKPEWQAVMYDLLRHKTPTRGPNALDVALNKSSFEIAFEKSVKEAATSSLAFEKSAKEACTSSQNHSAIEKDKISKKHHEKADRPKPVITSIQNVLITKKGIKLQNEISKPQTNNEIDHKTQSKQSVVAMNEKSKIHNTSVTTKKLPQELQRKNFTYSGPKNIDPFISGIPNSDYDLLDELMDDDLRKEIGELSSDDESYNAAAQSFLKPTNSSEKRVSVHFNKNINEPATKSATNERCLNDVQSVNEMLGLVTSKPVSQCTNKITHIRHESYLLKEKRAANKDLNSNCPMPSTSKSALTRIFTTSNAQNHAYNKPNQVMVEPNIYVSTIPQSAPVQNVVVLGQELVYGGYTSIQTPLQSVHSISPSAYVAVNATPAMTLYQTTQYTAPVIIGTSITVPVINNVPSSDISVQPNVNNTVVQPCNQAVIVEPQPSVMDHKISALTSDSHTEMKSEDDYSQPNYKFQEETKTSERKVLSEVQDLAMTENLDKTRSHKIDKNSIVNIKKDRVNDTERLKKKRLAILNREIYHRCGKDTIPLTYSPLPVKIETVLEIPLSTSFTSTKEDKQKLSDSEEEKLLEQIKNNLQDLSNAINEVSSPATPDSNDSKENKSCVTVPYRRILLRSSNKITPKLNTNRAISETPMSKKSNPKAKFKPELSEAAAVVCGNEKKEAPKRASKRLRNNKKIIITEEKNPLQQQLQKSSTKTKLSPSNKGISKLLKKSETKISEHQNIESGSKISKGGVETGNKDKIEHDNGKPTKFEVNTAVPGNLTNEQVISEASILQKCMSDNSSQKPVIFAPKANDDIIPENSILQKIDLLETTAVKIDEKCMSRRIIDSKIDENEFAVNLGNVRISDTILHDANKNTDDNLDDNEKSRQFIDAKIDKNNFTANSGNERRSSIILHRTNNNTDDNLDDVNKQGIIDVCVKVSRPFRNDLEKKPTTTNNDVLQRSLNVKVTEEIQPVPVLATDLRIPNVTKKPANKCDTLDNNTINDRNNSDLPEKYNIDLDMSVTCEEIPKQKLSPVFGTIKTARSKAINADKSNNLKGDKNISVHCEVIPKLSPTFDNIKIANGKHINTDKKEGENTEICDDLVPNNVITVRNNNTKQLEKSDAVSNVTEKLEKIEPGIETVNTEPTPKSWLGIETSKITPKAIVSSIPHIEKPTFRNTTAYIDDNVVVIDDDTNIKSVERKIGSSTENPANNKYHVINSVTNNANEGTRMLKHGKDKVSPSNMLTCSSDDKTQTETRTAIDSNLNNAKEFENFKDSIHIEHLPPNNPMTNRVRVSLPNGRKVIVTVGKEVCVTLDSLFTFPSIREALLNEKNRKKRYVMYVQQTTTINNSEPNKILSVHLNKIENPTHTPVETIDLLSDDDENEIRQIINTNKQEFVTEYGKFTASPMDRDLFIKHQYKFNQTSQILLKKVDAKSDLPKKIAEGTNHNPVINVVENILASKDNKLPAFTEVDTKLVKPREIENGIPEKYVKELKQNIENIFSKDNKALEVADRDMKLVTLKEIAHNDTKLVIPKQHVTGFTKNIESELGCALAAKPLVIPEVVEIDDSSNDTLYEGKSTEIVKEDKTINKLKNELLKELGVEVQTQESAITLKNELRHEDDDVEIIEEIKPPLNKKRRKMLKISVIPAGESCPFDDLDEKLQLQITKRKCAIKLVRCDELVKKYEQDVLDAMNQSDKILDELITINEDYAMFNNLDEKILEEDERSSSPVIELSDVLVSLENRTVHSISAMHQVALPCVANWHNTKSMLHLQSMTSAARCKVFENETNDDSFLDQAILCLQYDDETMAQSQVTKYDKDIVKSTSKSVIDQAIPLSCVANWLVSKPSLHLQSVNDVPLIRSYSDYDVDMYDDSSINKLIPLACKSNWLTTKPMLHMESVDNSTLERFHAFNNASNVNANSLRDQRLTLYCDDDWLSTKSTLHMQGVIDKALIRSECREEIFDDVCIDSIPLSCEANWLTTKSTLRWQSADDKSSEGFHVLNYDYKMCHNILIDKTIPLSCAANWFASKPTLRLQGLNDVSLIQSNFLEYDEFRDHSAIYNEIPLTCEANWLTTKSALHSNGRTKIIQLNEMDFETKMFNRKITSPLACEAIWFATKTTLHLEAARNLLLMPSDVLTNENENYCKRSSTFSVVNNTTSHQTDLKSGLPRLASLVLASVRYTNVIQQLILLRNASTRSHINLLKRKSSSLQGAAARKISKKDKIFQTTFCKSLPDMSNNTPGFDPGDISTDNIKYTKMIPYLNNKSANKILNSSLCATKCDDKHNFNIRVDAEEQVSGDDDCGNKEATTVSSNVIINNVNENHVLSESSHLLKEETKENIDSSGEYRCPYEINIKEADTYENKEVVNVDAADRNTDIDINSKDDALLSSAEVLGIQSNECFDSPRASRSPSPVICIKKFIVPENNTLLRFDLYNGHDSQPITVKQPSERSTESQSCNNVIERCLETENISEKQDKFNNIDDKVTADIYLQKRTIENEPYTNEKSDSGNCDELEAKLAEIVGESLLETNSTEKSPCYNEINMSDSEQSEIIQIILADEPFMNNDRKNIEVTVAREEEIGNIEDSDTFEYLKAGDHKYYTLGNSLGSIDQMSKDETETSYKDVVVLSENESPLELEEEIVDMRIDEIADNFFFDTTSNVNVTSEENNPRELSGDQTRGSVNLEQTLSNNKDCNKPGQVSFNKVCNDKEDKEIECKGTTAKDLIENDTVTNDNVKIEDHTAELLTDVSLEIILNKYRALIRNKSEVLESIVEYEDPETGTCCIIPIVEEPHNDIKSIENDEIDTPILDSESKEMKVNVTRRVSMDSSNQNNTSRLKEVNIHNGFNYDDIEVKLAEIVGEPLEENEISSGHGESDSYNTEKNLEDLSRQLSETIDKKSLVNLLRGKTISGASKKRQLKYRNKSEKNVNATDNLKMMKNLNATKGPEKIAHRKSSKRQMNSLDTKTVQRKYLKDTLVPFAKNKNENIHAHESGFNENYKFSYDVEVQEITTLERNTENVTNQWRDVIDQGSYKTEVKFAGRSKCNDISGQRSKYIDIENFQVTLPKVTYSKATEKLMTRQKSLKRKLDTPDAKTSERKYRKGKNIDYPKFTAAALTETVYAKEYKSLIDYCSSVKFSYAVPFHKEDIDVHDKLKSWPIKNIQPQTIELSVGRNERIFAEIEKSEALRDPLEQTLPEEISTEFDENSYTLCTIHETNFNMGFGERSGRVIQELKDGEYSTFSAATLSDVKQLQPLLPSDEKINYAKTNCTDSKSHDQKIKAMYFLHHLNLKEKVRSFFEKTKAEFALDWKYDSKKEDFENDNNMFSWPFGELTSTRCIKPSPVEITVNVVQVGQLPVSAAAQNPVTCDPRVTHVSNASPQCSPGNNLSDELQTPIKTEYTELTTADITLPLMQEYVQHHSMPSDSQHPANLFSANESTSMTTQIKSIVKIELMEETSQENEDNGDYENNGLQQLNGNISSVQYQFENIPSNVVPEPDPTVTTDSSKVSKTTFSNDKHSSDAVEKPDQLAHAMNAAGISATKGIVKSSNSVDTIPQNTQPNLVSASQTTTNNFSKGASINAVALQQALAQILPSSLNQTNISENNPQNSTNPQILHIVQGNNAQSVINKPNGTQLLHIVQNKPIANTNGTPASQQNNFSGLSLVDGAIQQGANQLLHIVNTTNQKNTNPGQLLKRVNLLTNLANVQGSNEQKMVQFVCKSADGKSIQLPHQRSMVLRLQPLDPPNVPTTPKQHDNHSSSSIAAHTVNEKESNPQEMKSRSLYEENYAKFVQNDAKFTHNGNSKASLEKATSLPKFNQVFGKQVYQDKQNEIDSENLPENTDTPEENNPSLEQMNDVTNPPILIRKTNQTQPSHVQPNLVQQIKQTIGPMNIQTMHGGVIYTRQIPVNIGNGQTINLITVPSTELADDSAQKQQTDGKFGNQEGDPPIIKIVPTNQPVTASNGSTDDNNAPLRSTSETTPQPNPQPQPVLTQMRIKLPMLSKAPQMVGGTRVVRPSFFQIQRNVIGGANQQVYQQLVLTAAPPLGQSIRLPAQVQKPKTPLEAQSSPESQMSSSTLEQLREFDMVLEQVKERSTVQPGSSSANNFTKLKSSPDTTDAQTSSTARTQESPTQVLYSVGNTQPLNMVNYVNRKSTITSTTTSSFVRSPDSTGTVESPSSSTHSQLPHTITSDSCASSSCASEAAAATSVQSKPKKKKLKPSTSNSNPFNIKNTPKPSSQKPLEDEQTTQRILYILAEYKEQVENSPDKDKPAPRRRNNPAAPNAGSSKRKKSSSGSRRRDMSPVLGEDSCRTMGSEDSSCGTSLGECNECLETHSPEESPKKVVRRLTFEQETQVTQTRTTTTTTTVPQRNVIVTDGQAFAVRGATGKPATTVLMPANYLLPVSMVKGGQQIAIVTNRGPKLLVGAGEGGTGGTLLFQRLIGPGGLKPVLARPGVRHIRLPTAALHNLQAFNIATPTAANVQPPDSTASPAPAPTPPDLVDTRAMSSPWPDRDTGEVKPERGNSSPEGSEPWNLPSSSIADDYGYEEIVRTDNMDRTVLDAIPDRYSPDLEAQRIFDKMFDSDSKKSMYDSRCGYDIDASDDDKAYHQVVHRKDGRHTTRLTHVSAAALRHKYAILEHELRLQKSLSEECEDLGVDSPSASELFPEAELLFAPSPAHEQTIDQCHTPQPTIHTQGISQPDLEDQIATDHLLTHKERHDDLDINLDDVGEIVTVGEDGMTTIPLDHEEFARSHEEFARSHPNTTFHSEPEDGEVPPFTIAQGVKGRQITFHSRGVPGTVVMAPQTTVISQATIEASGTQNPVKFSDIDNMINAMPSSQHGHINMPSVLKESNESLSKFDRLLNESRDLNLSNTASAIVHSTGNGTQVIRRVQYERRDSRYLVDDDAMIAGDSKTEERRDLIDDTSSSERHPELFWDTQSRPERKRFDFSSDSDKCSKSPYDEMNSDSSGIGAHTRLDSVIKAARTERRRSDESSAEESHPPLRTYPPKRTHQHSHHSHHDVDRSVTGKTRASDRCHDIKDESRRRASNRGVVKRGCHCCNGSTPPKPKKSRPKKSGDYPHN